MKREYSKEELLNKAEAYCSAAERCISEVQKKITLWGGELYCNEILSRLISDKFIDETRFAKAFVRDKYRFNKWGSNKIVQALKLKIAQVGIDSLLPDGSIYFEINRSFFKEIVAMLEEYGYRDIEVRKDCFGNERMVKARL